MNVPGNLKKLGMTLAIAVAGIVMTSPAAPARTESAQFEGCRVEGRTADYDFTLMDMNGREVSLTAYEGKVLLLDFWATWCAPCKIEIPGFIELYDRYRDRGFEVVGISVDDPVDQLRSFAAELGMSYPVLVGDGRDDVKDAYGPLIGFPTSMIIDRDGTVCYEHVGFATKEQFEADILSLL